MSKQKKRSITISITEQAYTILDHLSKSQKLDFSVAAEAIIGLGCQSYVEKVTAVTEAAKAASLEKKKGEENKGEAKVAAEPLKVVKDESV